MLPPIRKPYDSVARRAAATRSVGSAAASYLHAKTNGMGGTASMRQLYAGTLAHSHNGAREPGGGLLRVEVERLAGDQLVKHDVPINSASQASHRTAKGLKLCEHRYTTEIRRQRVGNESAARADIERCR